MIQIKKTLLTLVALLAVTTGAWADGTYTIKFEANGNSKTVENVTLPHTFSCDYSGENGELDQIIKQLYGLSGGCCSMNSPGASGNSNVTAGVNGDNQFITISAPFEGNATVTGAYFDAAKGYSDFDYSLTISCPGYDPNAGSSTPAASSGPEVAWDKDKNSGSFTMPGGNVELEPEYYPQATVADGGVTAADADARATTDDPLVKVDATKLTGAKKLMYFVSNSGTAPAYDAEGWTDQLPNAEGFTQQGIVYVWYYPVGTDEGVDGATATYSDGDICLQSITARIAAEPTYAVTFAEGVNPEPAEPEWTASPATGVKKGQTVTVTYTGTKKVIGVKAEKKEEPAETTVTLTTGQIGNLSYGQQKTIGDITIALSGNAYFHATSMMDVSGDAGPEPDPNQVYAVGTFTFTSSAGKIKRIDINHNVGLWWGAGDGWPDSYEVYDNSTFTWSGTPAASVTLNGSQKGFEWCNLNEISSIVFTIEK